MFEHIEIEKLYEGHFPRIFKENSLPESYIAQPLVTNPTPSGHMLAVYQHLAIVLRSIGKVWNTDTAFRALKVNVVNSGHTRCLEQGPSLRRTIYKGH